MPQQDTSLHEFNTPEILRVIWETFAGFARSPGARNTSKHFSIVGDRNIYDTAFENCNAAGLIPQRTNKWSCPSFQHIVLKVYHSAINMGLVIPHAPHQALDWNQVNGAFHFTDEGIRYFSEGFISIDDPGYLGETLFELKGRTDLIEDGRLSCFSKLRDASSPAVLERAWLLLVLRVKMLAWDCWMPSLLIVRLRRAVQRYMVIGAVAATRPLPFL